MVDENSNDGNKTEFYLHRWVVVVVVAVDWVHIFTWDFQWIAFCSFLFDDVESGNQ